MSGHPTKYVFVTGGVVSSLGKGITAASLGRLLKARGLKRGVATLCIGGGEATAMAFEMV